MSTSWNNVSKVSATTWNNVSEVGEAWLYNDPLISYNEIGILYEAFYAVTNYSNVSKVSPTSWNNVAKV